MTAEDGSFRFTEVPAGEVSLTVTYTGYSTIRETFTVAAPLSGSSLPQSAVHIHDNHTMLVSFGRLRP